MASIHDVQRWVCYKMAGKGTQTIRLTISGSLFKPGWLKLDSFRHPSWPLMVQTYVYHAWKTAKPQFLMSRTTCLSKNMRWIFT